MAARNLALALSLVLGAVACSDRTQEVKSPAAAPAPPPADPPPAIPPSLVAPQEAAVAPAAPGSPAETPAPVVAAGDTKTLDVNANAKDDELANIGPNQAQLEAQARENAQAMAKDKAKWAKMAHDADRKGTEDWSRDHTQKAAQRAVQLQNQSSRIAPARRGKFNTDMTMFQTRKADVLSRINGLGSAGPEEWKVRKQQLDNAINEMDAALNRLEGDF